MSDKLPVGFFSDPDNFMLTYSVELDTSVIDKIAPFHIDTSNLLSEIVLVACDEKHKAQYPKLLDRLNSCNYTDLVFAASDKQPVFELGGIFNRGGAIMTCIVIRLIAPSVSVSVPSHIEATDKATALTCCGTRQMK